MVPYTVLIYFMVHIILIYGSLKINSANYPLFESNNFNLIFGGSGTGFTTASVNIIYRKVYVGSVGTVSFTINPFSITLGTASVTSVIATTLLASGLRPSSTVNLPIFLNKSSGRFMGCFYILTTGECGFVDVVIPATWTTNSASCGNPFVQGITYVL